MESLQVANTHFCLDLFIKMGKRNHIQNVFYSPLSISSALAMVSLGAAGNTAVQMSKSLHFHHAKEDIHNGFNKLLGELNKAGAPYALSLASRLYGDQSYQFVEKFLGDSKTYYQAELETVDFKSNPDSARVTINEWVEKKTQDKIKNLLAEGVVDNLTRLVLVNAIYFLGNWEKTFTPFDTCEAPFKLNKKEIKTVQMMHQTEWFNMASIPSLNCKILEMQYVGNELSMLIMLPNEMEDDTTGLEKLEKELTYENYMEWTQPDRMNHVKVEVSIPRFKLEETYDLKDVLINMGIVEAFDRNKCDFSQMSPSDDLVLSKVVHKAFVEVNEAGTEAAAATAVIIEELCCSRQTPFFVADHPFLFFIQHKSTRSVLFCGRYCSP